MGYDQKNREPLLKAATLKTDRPPNVAESVLILSVLGGMVWLSTMGMIALCGGCTPRKPNQQNVEREIIQRMQDSTRKWKH